MEYNNKDSFLIKEEKLMTLLQFLPYFISLTTAFVTNYVVTY